MPARIPLNCVDPDNTKLTAILFSRTNDKHVTVKVSTAMDPASHNIRRFPSLESFLGGGAGLFETWVTCRDAQGLQHRFLIGARYCANDEANRALQKVQPEVMWKGDLIVMRGGVVASVINMGNRDLAVIAVRRFLVETAPLVFAALQNNTPIIIPDHLPNDV